ncbi:MAG: lytic transglycosylase domain-containing protein [Caulobacteraceae bacterium]
MAATVGVLALSGAAQAQVIEVDAGGEVAVYSGPTVFTDAGAAPIVPPVVRAPAQRSGQPAERATVMRELNAAASEFALSPELVEAVAWRESRLRHDAVSSAGAVGVMQLMPGTAAQLGVDQRDLSQNIRGGTAYLQRMVAEFGGDIVLGLAAYNAGPAAVRRYGGVPPYAETQAYVSAILDRLAQRALGH